MVDVRKENQNTFIVSVTEGGSVTKHTVRLDDTYFQKLTGGTGDKERLIKESFQFLLEHEPKESILRSFDLQVIGRYFPEYESTISGKS
ncbi:hypothetical protein B4O97_08760 [Marispirochaeta aestuarii]|uniref:Uncharacterized protein n=1 Tax=Marispirochaeta aestuarii TaxID=1963862 RepID=A0A1Y1RYR5_9SPIO|nr:hypothetical protein [Marispirochaeta aestuarii]ORC35721.1 hypothetical protein B4O97_08760 [Marispirochaeta aestuarii]